MAFSDFVFDFDGTLFRLPVDWEAVRGNLRSVLGSDSSFAPLFGELARVLGEKPELRGPAFGAIDSFEVAGAALAEPVEGAPDLLRELSRRGKVAIVTMQGRMALGAVLAKFSLDEVPSATVTREDSLERSAQIVEAMGRIGAAREGTLFVGDRVNDVVGGRKAGVKVAVVGRTITGQVRPDYNFLTVGELSRFLSS